MHRKRSLIVLCFVGSLIATANASELKIDEYKLNDTMNPDGSGGKADVLPTLDPVAILTFSTDGGRTTQTVHVSYESTYFYTETWSNGDDVGCIRWEVEEWESGLFYTYAIKQKRANGDWVTIADGTMY